MPKKSKSEAAYDSCAKKILSNKFLIAHILKECLEEYKNVDIDYIVTNCLNSKVRVLKCICPAIYRTAQNIWG
ncbi:MAG: hypothetical protein ACI4WM_02520 [Erysipelotrichaceae bacterium]